jgi:hypothetical protein
MHRRDFMAFLGSAAIATPSLAKAQTPTKAFRLAVVSPMGLERDCLWLNRLGIPKSAGF